MAYPITTTREQWVMALLNSSSNCVKQSRQVGEASSRELVTLHSVSGCEKVLPIRPVRV